MAVAEVGVEVEDVGSARLVPEEVVFRLVVHGLRIAGCEAVADEVTLVSDENFERGALAYRGANFCSLFLPPAAVAQIATKLSHTSIQMSDVR